MPAINILLFAYLVYLICLEFVMLYVVFFCHPVRVSHFFAWYDFWIGLYWDRKKRVLYVFYLPMCGIKLELEKKED